jgi:hypothetical protein
MLATLTRPEVTLTGIAAFPDLVRRETALAGCGRELKAVRSLSTSQGFGRTVRV